MHVDARAGALRSKGNFVLNFFFTREMVELEQKYPENIGIVAMECYFPATYVEQSELGKVFNCSEFLTD